MVAMGGTHTHTDERAVACWRGPGENPMYLGFCGVVRSSLKQDGPILNVNNTRLSPQPALRDS